MLIPFTHWNTTNSLLLLYIRRNNTFFCGILQKLNDRNNWNLFYSLFLVPLGITFVNCGIKSSVPARIFLLRLPFSAVRVIHINMTGIWRALQTFLISQFRQFSTWETKQCAPYISCMGVSYRAVNNSTRTTNKLNP